MKIFNSDYKSLSELISQATFVHHQDGSSAVWTINHYLGKQPSITCVNGSNELIFGDVVYVDNNQCTVTFISAITGKAYLN